MTGEQITFGLVHGSWHGAWCWDELQNELGQLGHASLSVDLPIEDLYATFDDYADSAVNAFKGAENLVLVGHSRAGNVLPRAAGQLAARQMIFVAASFEYSTISHPTPTERQDVPLRNSPEFNDGVRHIGNGLTAFNKDKAKNLFYNDCDEATQDWAVSKFRNQLRTDIGPKLDVWPKIPAEYVICNNDRVLRPAWSEYVSRKWLGVEPTYFESDHSPFLSHPKSFAQFLINLAEK